MKRIKSVISKIDSVDCVLTLAMCLYLTFLIININKLF